MRPRKGKAKHWAGRTSIYSAISLVRQLAFSHFSSSCLISANAALVLLTGATGLCLNKHNWDSEVRFWVLIHLYHRFTLKHPYLLHESEVRIIGVTKRTKIWSLEWFLLQIRVSNARTRILRTFGVLMSSRTVCLDSWIITFCFQHIHTKDSFFVLMILVNRSNWSSDEKEEDFIEINSG